MPELATVDYLPGRDWSAKGAAGDALQRVPDKGAFLAIWVDEKQLVHYSKANTSGSSLVLMAAYVQAMAQRCVEEALDA